MGRIYLVVCGERCSSLRVHVLTWTTRIRYQSIPFVMRGCRTSFPAEVILGYHLRTKKKCTANDCILSGPPLRVLVATVSLLHHLLMPSFIVDLALSITSLLRSIWYLCWYCCAGCQISRCCEHGAIVIWGSYCSTNRLTVLRWLTSQGLCSGLLFGGGNEDEVSCWRPCCVLSWRLSRGRPIC